MKTYKEYLSLVELIATEILNETTDRDEAMDSVWEHVEGTAEVIYYGRAFDMIGIVWDSDGHLFNDANRDLEDSCTEAETADFREHCCQLARRILTSSVMDELAERFEEIEEREASEELAEEIAAA